MYKKLLGLLLTLILTLGIVGCSSQESEKVDSGDATPTEKKKDDPVKEDKQEEVVLIDDELVKIVITEKVNDEIMGKMYKLVIENKSEQKIIVQSRDMSVDGVMQDPIFSVDIMPEKKANADMIFMEVDSLDGLKNVEGRLIIIDENYSDLNSYNINIE